MDPILLPLPDRLNRAIHLFRYAVYATLVLLGFWCSYQDMSHVSSWLTLLVVIPLICRVLSQLSATAVYIVLVFESFAVAGLLWLLGYDDLAIGFVGLAVLCNVALWGLKSAPALITGALAIYLALQMDVQFGVVGIYAWFLGFAVLVHDQARVHLTRKSLLLEHDATVRRYLPSDFDVSPDHRRVWLTIAFIDLGGFTRAVDSLSPEMTRDILNEFLDSVTRVVEEAGGNVSKFLGDGVLCLFEPDEIDARGTSAQICLAVVHDLLAAVPEFNEVWRRRGCPHRFHLTAGIASGHCSLGRWGGDTRLDFTAIGTPVNYAHRLQDAATSEDAVLLDDVTAELLGGDTPVRKTELLALKGLSNRPSYRPCQPLPQKA